MFSEPGESSMRKSYEKYQRRSGMRWVKVFALSAATALAAMATVGTDSFRWSGKMTAGQVLEVRGVNGSIHAEGGSGDEIEVIARQSGHWADSSGVRGEEGRQAG